MGDNPKMGRQDNHVYREGRCNAGQGVVMNRLLRTAAGSLPFKLESDRHRDQLVGIMRILSNDQRQPVESPGCLKMLQHAAVPTSKVLSAIRSQRCHP